MRARRGAKPRRRVVARPTTARARVVRVTRVLGVSAFAVAAAFVALSAGAQHPQSEDATSQDGPRNVDARLFTGLRQLPVASSASTSSSTTFVTVAATTTVASSQATAPSTPSSTGAAALRLIDYPWERLGYSVNFAPARSGLLAKTNCNTKTISIYVRSTQTVRQVAFVTAFELGHAVDCSTMSDQRRADWAGLRGFPTGWRWFPGCLCSEDHFGSGDFAQVFAAWLVADSGYSWRSRLAGPPGSQLGQLMPYLRPAAIG